MGDTVSTSKEVIPKKLHKKKHPPTGIGERHIKVIYFNDYYIMAGAIFKALGDKLGSKSVSYTHLTLPTICSV